MAELRSSRAPAPCRQAWAGTGAARAGGREDYLASAWHMRPSPSPPRIPQEPGGLAPRRVVGAGQPPSLPGPFLPYREQSGKPIQARGGGVRGLPPRAAAMSVFLGLPPPRNTVLGCCSSRREAVWLLIVCFSSLGAPGSVRRPGCRPVLGPELPHFTFH